MGRVSNTAGHSRGGFKSLSDTCLRTCLTAHARGRTCPAPVHLMCPRADCRFCAGLGSESPAVRRRCRPSRLVCGCGPYALPGFAVALGHVLAHSERHSTSDHLHGSIVIDAHLVAVSIRLQNVADLLGGDTETFTDLGNGKRIGTRRGAFPDVNVEPSGLVAALSARRAVAAARLQSGRREQNCCQVPALRTSRPR
jgi:hypothetical protein